MNTTYRQAFTGFDFSTSNPAPTFSLSLFFSVSVSVKGTYLWCVGAGTPVKPALPDATAWRLAGGYSAPLLPFHPFLLWATPFSQDEHLFSAHLQYTHTHARTHTQPTDDVKSIKCSKESMGGARARRVTWTECKTCCREHTSAPISHLIPMITWKL